MPRLPNTCHVTATAGLMALILAGPAAHADTVAARCDLYAKGADRASAVLPCSFSQRQGYIAIDRADGVRHELSPQGAAGNYVDQDGKPAHRNRGLGNRGMIFRLSGETIYVYWDTAGLPGAAAAPAEAPGATPSSSPPGRPMLSASQVPPVPFDRTLTLQGVSFRVWCANGSSLNTLLIAPAGLQIENRHITRSIDGQVAGAEVADLDADGSPELYVYVRSAGSGSYGSLAAFGANRRKSLSDIYVPPITEHPTASAGYMGHDEFAVGEGRLLRRFPVYRAGDVNAAPTGGMRQLQYKLTAGEAGWVLRVDRVVAY